MPVSSNTPDRRLTPKQINHVCAVLFLYRIRMHDEETNGAACIRVGSQCCNASVSSQCKYHIEMGYRDAEVILDICKQLELPKANCRGNSK